MKNLIIYVFALLCTTIVKSQQFETNSMLSLNLGPSIPLSDFASSDIDNDAAGFAVTGSHLHISYAHNHTENFGTIAMLLMNFNSTDNQTLANELAQEVPGSTIIVESDGWLTMGGMGGIYLTAPMTKLSVDFKGLLGFLSYDSPEYNIEANSEDLQITSVNSVALSYGLGLTLRYRAGKLISLLVNYDYIGANPELKNVRFVYPDGSYDTDTYSQKYGVFNITGGIGFNF